MAPVPVHRDEARRFAYGVGTLVAFAVVAVIGGIVQVGGPLPGRDYTYVNADFTDVGVLKTGKEVKEDGLPIGTVSGIEYVDGRARVTLRLEGDVGVYQNASAAVSNVSVLGKKYVDFDPGTPRAGALGETVLTTEQTRDDTSLEDVLSALDPRTRTALKSSVGELATGLTGHGEQLNVALRVAPDLLDDLETVAASAAGRDADLAGLLTSADTLVSRFEGRERQLSSLLHNLDDTVGALGVDDGRPLRATLAALPSTLTETNRALHQLKPPLVDTRAALRTLRPGGRSLGAATPTLRSFLRRAPGPLDKVPPIGAQATPVVEDLTTTVADARPLVEPAQRTLADLDRLLLPFSDYAGDAGRFFSQHDLLSGTLGSEDKHYFAALLTGPGLFSVNGAPDPLYRREPYPFPGTAWNKSTVTDSESHYQGGDR
jgi:phospholipid/cholesterol/gamma-HCH transport system substrate-binding protein